jgi:SAM-dependent methyltransferase
MYTDMQTAKKLVFIGSSQRSLVGFLREAIRRTSSQTLPWEEIEVYFAPPEIGQLYDDEGPNFTVKVREVRQSVAGFLTDPTRKGWLAAFQEVQFSEMRRPMTYTGAMFGPGGVDHEFSTIYVVHSRFYGVNFNQDITTRFTFTDSSASERPSAVHMARMAHYAEAYTNIRRESRSLGRFQRSVWDESADQWSRFLTGSRVLIESMAALVELNDIKPGATILDVGAGPGDTSELLLQWSGHGGITLLDASPQMVQFARRKFQGRSSVDIALCAVQPDQSILNVDLNSRLFSVLVFHQSLGNVAEAFNNDLVALARWCFQSVESGGQVIIAVHNGVIEAAKPKGYENWEDEFRIALDREIRRILAWRLYRKGPRTRSLFKREGIENAFRSQGFSGGIKDQRVISMTMDERVLMWRVPAVMNSVVDVVAGGIDHLSAVCDNLQRELAGKISMPQTVTYWTFRREE